MKLTLISTSVMLIVWIFLAAAAVYLIYLIMKALRKYTKSMPVRKEKDERYDPNSYNEFVCMQFEHDTLGYSITYKSWWDNICLEEKVSNEATLLSTKEIVDKKGRLMAFIELEINNCKINATVYSNKYSRYVSCFDTNLTKKIYVEGQKQNGKKDGETILIINKAKRIAA